MAKKVVMILGWVFVVVGLLGFVSHPILGIFPVNTLHNIIHLLSGVLALVASSKGEEASVMFAKIFGVVYALVTLLGFFASGFINNLIMGGAADNVLHLVLAVVLLYVGFGSGSKMQSGNMPQM